MQSHQTFSIPEFSHKEILQYFTDLQIPLTSTDLIKPTPGVIQTLYESVLTIFTNFKISDHLPDNESAESVYLAILLNQLTNFAIDIGFTITFRDLISPDNKRFITILSHIMNFSMFRDSKREVYEMVIRSCREKEEMKDEIEEKISDALRRLEEAETTQEKIKLEMNNIEAEINELEDTLKGEYKKYRALANDVEQLKAEKNELSDAESSNQLLLINSKQEVACLKAQIVGDPTKLLELIQEMKEMVYKEKSQISVLNKKKDLTIKNIRFFEEKRHDIIELIKKCVNLKNKYQRDEDARKRITFLESDIELRASALDTCEKKVLLLERQIEVVEGKLSSLKEHSEKSNDGVIARMEALKVNYVKINVDRDALNEKIEANHNWTREIESEISLKQNEYSTFVNEKKMMINDLSNAMFRYFNEMKSLLNKYT